ncbi:PfkB family carbohydrate kinase [Nocardia asteroides]|uniref:PfkB family carbohydrate kinase n=1 Tax=Nocardia asteroides TaxID=1824 RepID=UPI001E64165C|nr:PfkB family carbohydrate kinase [Nocardia asteroides]UGT60947.1 PfkB family carbohydrate kinase [Nocardia asteroides]
MSGPVVVVGDILLDIDVDGRAERCCPDAPVPVVDIVSRSYRPGGAGLAALLAAGDAGEVLLLGGIGADEGGARLLELLDGAVRVLPLPLRGGTPCKERVRATGPWAGGTGRGGPEPVPITRLDHGDGRVPGSPLTAEARAALRRAGAVLVADYGRGVAAHPEIRSVLTELAGRVPIVWDPHPRGPAPIPGVTLATPNRAEAAARTGEAEPGGMVRELLRMWAARAVAVTLGPEGALLGDADGVRAVPLAEPDRAAAGADTCGAGDRFAAAATTALAGGADPAAAVRAAVRAAAEFVGAGAAAAVGVTVDPVAGRVAG